MKKILIVDDNEANLYMLEILLKGEGFEVISAANGKEAWEKALLEPPDLIVTDVLMPVMDGYALCKQWKSDDKLKHIPFVIYTATYTGTKNEAFALSLGADRFILKPQEPEALLHLLKEVLADNYSAKQVETKPLEEEIQFFRQYNEILFNKLEKKMSDLETANRDLKILAERYRLSFENVSDVIYMIDNDFNIISMSPSVERIMGYKPEEFIGRPVTDLANIFAAEALDQAVMEIDLILKGHPISSVTYEFIAKDGSIRIGEVSGSPIMQEDKIIGMIAIARDVTDRQRAQKELRESERQYRELYDFLPIPAYEMDFNANITFANRAIYETFRGTEADIKKGFNAWQLLSEADGVKSRQNIERLLHGEQVGSTEYTFKRLDGSLFPALVTSSVLYRNEKPVGLRGAIIDITELKRVENDLRKSEEKYRFLFNNASESILVIQEGTIRFANPASLILSGYPEEELLFKPFTEFIHPKDREMVYGYYKKRIAGEAVSSNYTFRIKTQDGAIKWVAIHAALVDWEGSSATLNFLSDITDQKRATEALRESEEKYRSLFEHLQDAVLLTRPDGSIIEANKTACEMFGRSVDELRAVGRSALVDEADPCLKAAMEERARTGQARAEITMIRANGEKFLADITSTIFTDVNGQQKTSMIVRDITDRKKAEEALQFRNVLLSTQQEVSIDGILVVDEKSQILSYNNQFVKMWGIPANLVEARDDEPVLQFVTAQMADPTSFFRQVQYLYEHRNETSRDELLLADGRVFDRYSSPMLGPHHRYFGRVWYFRDITDRKQAEDALLESENRYRHVFQDHAAVKLIIDPDTGNIIEANQAAVNYYGWSQEEIKQMNIQNINTLPPEDVKKLMERVLTETQISFEVCHRRADGSVRDVEVFSSRINVKGKPLLHSIVHDISERKKAEDSLRSSEARFRSYFDLPLIGIAITSPEKGWLEGNDRLSAILGYPWQELRNMTWDELTHPDDLAADVEQFNRVLAGEIESYMLDKRFIRKSGEVIWTSLAAGCVRKQDGAVDYFVVLLDDITERKESVNRLRKSLGATIQAMAVTVEVRDPYTAGHQHRVADLARSIAAEMGLPADQINGIRMAATIHDLGKISVPAELLSMPRKLTDIEFSLIKMHSRSGYDILKDIEFPWPIARIILEHHERMDGSGYPQGLMGDDILIESRIISVADVVESMASHRPYRASLGINAALEEIAKNRGKLYDDNVVDACLRLFHEKGFQLLAV